MVNYPFLTPAFFSSLEESGSTTAATGWQPIHQSIVEGGAEKAFMPLYLKEHSYGEYVFDWAWADAYHRNGYNYYPKLLTAIPFTPATGPRIRLADDTDAAALARQLAASTLELAKDRQVSSWHLLFPNEEHLNLFNTPDMLHRKGVQYHWFNRGYGEFDDFLATFNSRKRKMVRKERREVAGHHLAIERYTGPDITADMWRLFALFYQRTYIKRSGSRGYLTPRFFDLLGNQLRDNCLMVCARNGKEIVASALYFFDSERLYGRYWGCAREYDFLHFELCYYQGIEFAIERGLRVFDAGAQGEHKILRGFEPVITHSLHWIAEPVFADAIARFLKEETIYIRRHLDQARSLLPYKSDSQ